MLIESIKLPKELEGEVWIDAVAEELIGATLKPIVIGGKKLKLHAEGRIGTVRGERRTSVSMLVSEAGLKLLTSTYPTGVMPVTVGMEVAHMQLLGATPRDNVHLCVQAFLRKGTGQ